GRARSREGDGARVDPGDPALDLRLATGGPGAARVQRDRATLRARLRAAERCRRHVGRRGAAAAVDQVGGGVVPHLPGSHAQRGQALRRQQRRGEARDRARRHGLRGGQGRRGRLRAECGRRQGVDGWRAGPAPDAGEGPGPRGTPGTGFAAGWRYETVRGRAGLKIPGTAANAILRRLAGRSCRDLALLGAPVAIAEALLELLDPAFRVNEALLAGEERVVA